MKNTTRLLDVLDRAETGPIVEEQMHDMMTIPGVMSGLLAEYDIRLPRPEEAVVLARWCI